MRESSTNVSRYLFSTHVRLKSLASQHFGKKTMDSKCLIKHFVVWYRCAFLLVICICKNIVNKKVNLYF